MGMVECLLDHPPQSPASGCICAHFEISALTDEDCSLDFCPDVTKVSTQQRLFCHCKVSPGIHSISCHEMYDDSEPMSQYHLLIMGMILKEVCCMLRANEAAITPKIRFLALYWFTIVPMKNENWESMSLCACRPTPRVLILRLQVISVEISRQPNM